MGVCQGVPLMITRLSGQGSSPAKARSRVVLPLPEGPNTAVTPRAGSSSLAFNWNVPRSI